MEHKDIGTHDLVMGGHQRLMALLGPDDKLALCSGKIILDNQNGLAICPGTGLPPGADVSTLVIISSFYLLIHLKAIFFS